MFLNYEKLLHSFRKELDNDRRYLLPEDETIEFARYCVENAPKPDTAAMQKEIDHWCRTDPKNTFPLPADEWFQHAYAAYRDSGGNQWANLGFAMYCFQRWAAEQLAAKGAHYISDLNDRWRSIYGLPDDSEAKEDAIAKWRKLADKRNAEDRDSAELGAAMADGCCPTGCCAQGCCEESKAIAPETDETANSKALVETKDTTPAHYACLPKEYRPTDVARQWIEAAGDRITPWQASLLFQVMKYAGRFPFKGDPIGDLLKLIDYAEQLREEVISIEFEKHHTGA